MTAALPHAIANARIARLAGHEAMRATLSGVTEAPSEMPSAMLAACPSRVGTRTGRRAIAATATAMMAPDSQPAGNRARPSAAPPTAPMTSVSVRRRKVWRSDSDDAISHASREAGRKPLHGGFELLGVAGKAQTQEAAARGAEGAA